MHQKIPSRLAPQNTLIINQAIPIYKNKKSQKNIQPKRGDKKLRREPKVLFTYHVSQNQFITFKRMRIPLFNMPIINPHSK